ncbi:EamA family transporter [Blautia sp. RD014234]|nr:EamA family transporter [Blautia parvula]
MNSKKAEMLMVSVSFVWGSSYLLMKIGLGSIAPFNLIALRFGIAFLFMTLVFPKVPLSQAFRYRKRDSDGNSFVSHIFRDGLWCQPYHCIHRRVFSQHYRYFYSHSGEYHMEKTPRRLVLSSILLAGAGLYLLTAKNGLSLNGGAIYSLAGAFFMLFISFCLKKPLKLQTPSFSAPSSLVLLPRVPPSV